MASGENRKRNRKGAGKDRSLWGSLFKKDDEPQEDFMRHSFFQQEEEEEAPRFSPYNALSLLWRKFNFWTTTAILLFLSFTAVLLTLLINMWRPQDLKDIAGYTDNGTTRDLSALIRNANGHEISFTEAELNRYLRDTCRLRQTGIFSIIAKCQGVAVRIHDGYAEVVIDRIIGANIHQTTTVNLTFRRVIEHGRPRLHVDFNGGAPLLNNMPRGGSIGQVSVPQHHIRMLKPALETLVACYPDIVEQVELYGYCPEFSKSGGMEGRIRLVPYTFSTNQTL